MDTCQKGECNQGGKGSEPRFLSQRDAHRVLAAEDVQEVEVLQERRAARLNMFMLDTLSSNYGGSSVCMRKPGEPCTKSVAMERPIARDMLQPSSQKSMAKSRTCKKQHRSRSHRSPCEVAKHSFRQTI